MLAWGRILFRAYHEGHRQSDLLDAQELGPKLGPYHFLPFPQISTALLPSLPSGLYTSGRPNFILHKIALLTFLALLFS